MQWLQYLKFEAMKAKAAAEKIIPMQRRTA